MTAMFTLGEAARQSGIAKGTISKAIKAGKLSATRRENATWSIDPAELDRYIKTRRPLSADTWIWSEDHSMVRLTIDVPEGLHRQVKVECAKRGIKMADMIRELLKVFLTLRASSNIGQSIQIHERTNSQ